MKATATQMSNRINIQVMKTTLTNIGERCRSVALCATSNAGGPAATYIHSDNVSNLYAIPGPGGARPHAITTTALAERHDRK
jgi:hypothetical protein